MVKLQALLLVAAIAGCSRHAEPPAPAQPATAPARTPVPAPAPAAPKPVQPAGEAVRETDRVDPALANGLMVAIFAGDYDPAKKLAMATIADGENAGPWLMSLYDTHELPGGRMVAIVNGAPSDDEGRDRATHASPGMLNVFVLKREGEAWTVLERHLDAATMGSHGSIGSTQWIDLGPDKPGFIVLSGGTWQGQSMTVASIFELAHGVRALGDFRAKSDNEGDCGPDTEECWDVAGTIAIADAPQPGAYRDIVVDFTDRRYSFKVDEKDNVVDHVERTNRQTARYAFDGTKYTLVSGINPVPGI